MTDSESMFQNYCDALKMVEDAEAAPNLTVKYLPTFARVYPQNQIDTFKQTFNDQVLPEVASQLCMMRCRNNRQPKCYESCLSYFTKAMTDGVNKIHRIHKQYKIVAADDEQ